MDIGGLLQALRLTLVGGVFVLVTVELWLFYSQRRSVHIWGAFSMLLVAGFVVSRYVNLGDVSTVVGLSSARSQWSTMLLFGGSILITLRAATDLAINTRVKATFGYGVVLAILAWFDGPLTTGHISIVEDGLGIPMRAADVSLFAPALLLPFILLVMYDLYRIDIGTSGLARKQWKAVRISSALAAAAALNDVGLAGGFISGTPAMLDFVLGGVTLSVVFVLASYSENAFMVLERAVQDRTADLGVTVASLRGLISGLPDMVLVIRGESVELYNERAQHDLGGASSRKLSEVGQTPEESDRLRELCQAATETPSFIRMDLKSTRGPVAADVVAVAVTLDGERTIIANARSTRERDEMEQSLRMADRLSSVGTLAAGIAHEINNPMTFVTANVQYCIEALGDAGGYDDEIDALKDALEGSRRVAEIVTELRTFATPEQPNEFAQADLEESLDLALRLTGHTLRHHTQVNVDIPDDLPEVRGDTGRLSQVFVNLLTNAADAMPSDRTTQENIINVTATETPRGVQIEFRDNGLGMDDVDVKRAFDPFFTTKEVGEGTGLGLSICHNIIREIGGDIRLTSKPGRGTQVVIDLDRSYTYEEASEAFGAGRHTGRVLVIDDEELVLKATVRLLRQYNVDTVTSAEEAMDRVRETTYDVILCDVMMPEMNGLDFRDWLGRQDTSLRDRVVFFTGGAIGDDIEARLHASGAPIVRKPMELSRLELAFSKVRDRASE